MRDGVISEAPRADRSADNAAAIAVLFDAEDVELFRGHRASGTVALALTPAARLALGSWSDGIGAPTPRLTDLGHARVAAAARRGGSRFRKAMEEAGCGPAETVVTWHRVELAICLAHRLHRTIGCRGPWLVPLRTGLVLERDRRGALAALAHRIGIGEWLPSSAPLAPRLFAMCRRTAAFLMRLRKRKWIATGPGKPRFDFDKELAKGGVGRCVIALPTQGNREYVRLGIRTARILSGATETAAFTVLPTKKPRHVEDAVRTALNAINDPIADPVLRIFEDRLADYASTTASCADDAAAVLAALKVTHTLSWENNASGNAIVAAAGGLAGCLRLNANHNSWPENASALADSVVGGLLQRRLDNPLTDIVLAWSPMTDRAVGKNSKTSIACAPLDTVVEPPQQPMPQGSFKLLHAGNYQGWSDIFPVIAETSDEFLDGIVRLARVAEDVAGITTQVRIRNKGECNLAVVSDKLAGMKNVTPVGTDMDFRHHIASCDLLVSFMSTTIEEALQLRRPVLLWGQTRRYLHLPASDVPPTVSARSATYVAHDEAHLAVMLPAIVEAHRGRPLTDSEIAPWRWRDASNVRDIVARLRDGRPLDITLR